MSSSQQTLDTPPDRVRRRLEANRQKFIESGIYLAEPEHSFTNDVTWKRIGRGYQLVTNESVEAANTKTANSNITNDQQDSDDEETIENDPNSLLEQAVFSVVVQISYDDCWLTPCGHWKGPNQVTRKFEDLKLSFHGEQPSHEVFANDFTTSISNIRKLIDDQIKTSGCDPNAIQRRFLIPSRKDGSYVLKFRHAVFQVSRSRSMPVSMNVAEILNFQKVDRNASDTASDSDGAS